MADREREKKKKRAYLDDFEKDLNGNYQYRGAHYRYAGGYPHSRVLALLWLFCGGGAALTVGAGALPRSSSSTVPRRGRATRSRCSGHSTVVNCFSARMARCFATRAAHSASQTCIVAR